MTPVKGIQRAAFPGPWPTGPLLSYSNGNFLIFSILPLSQRKCESVCFVLSRGLPPSECYCINHSSATSTGDWAIDARNQIFENTFRGQSSGWRMKTSKAVCSERRESVILVKPRMVLCSGEVAHKRLVSHLTPVWAPLVEPVPHLDRVKD